MAVSFEATSNQQLTAAGSTHTKGAYVQLLASSAAAASAIVVYFGTSQTAARNFLFDIATGGAGAETDVIANILFQESGTIGNLMNVPIIVPIPIASGTRISARCQSSAVSGTMEVNATLVNQGVTRTSSATTYGVNTGTTRGTQIDPGATPSTKGAWVEITASTSAIMKWLTALFGINANTVTSTAVWFVDIGTGAAGAETVLIPDIRLRSSAAADNLNPGAVCFPVNIASGTRLAVRASCSTADATDRLFDCSIIGVNDDLGAGGGAGGVSRSRVVNQ